MLYMTDVTHCEICNTQLDENKPDSPVFCDKCIEEMEKLSLSPEKYKEYKELRETL